MTTDNTISTLTEIETTETIETDNQVKIAKNVIIMVPDGMGWEMARAGAIAKQLLEGHTGTSLSDFYTEGKGSGLSFQELENFSYATTYPTVVLGDNRQSALEGNALRRPTGVAAVAVDSDFVFDPTFNPEEDPDGGNLVGYDPVRGGINPWTLGTDPEYLKLGWSDSSAAGTSIFTGMKTYGSGLGVDIFEQPVENIMSIAAGLGKSTGTLSDVPISHATPSAPAAHVNHRNKYDSDYPDTDSILQQMLRTAKVDLMLGGGHPLDLNNSTEESGQLQFTFINESTYNELSNNPTNNLYGYTFLERGPDAAQVLIDTVADLDPEAGDRIFGLYGARGQNGNLPMRNGDGSYTNTGFTTFGHRSSQLNGPSTPEYMRPLAPGETDEEFIARELNENPTLAQMSLAALDFLSKDPDGFFLHIEAGDLDWVLHDNNIDTTIGRMLDFDESVQVVMDWIEVNGGWEENLLLIVPDHDHYLTLNDNFPALLQENGSAELTLEFDPDAAGHFWGSDPTNKYDWGTHSNRPVPIYYQGAGSEILDSFIGEGFTIYGAEVEGIPEHLDLVHIFYTMKAAMTGMNLEDLMAVEDKVIVVGNDEMQFGGNGNDELVSTGSNNRLFGGNGNDTLVAQSNDTLIGGVGDDVLYSMGAGGNTLVGGLGADQFWVAYDSLPEDVNTVVDFEVGTDVIGFWGISEVSSFEDLILTESEIGTTISFGEQDIAILLDVEASVIDSSSFVFVEGDGTGSADILGTEGDDVLVGTDADEVIDAVGGNNIVAGGFGNDTIFGGLGDDILRGDANSRSPGGSEGGDDVIFGIGGNNRIGGKGGNDLLVGGTGNDEIFGDDGDDTLMGGPGNDTLTGNNFSGGQGSNLFIFANGHGTDLVTDFNPAKDMIGLVEDDLVFDDLVITNSRAGATISVMESGETLAVFRGVNADALTEDLFIATPDVSLMFG